VYRSNQDDGVAVTLADGPVLLGDANGPEIWVSAEFFEAERRVACVVEKKTISAPGGLACAISQPVDVHRFITFGGRLPHERFKPRAGFRIGQDPLPSILVLPGQQKAGEVGDLRLLVRGQGLANPDNFFGGSAHTLRLAQGGSEFKAKG
jgi:hypothetical protein